jgi:biopolymer transport protein TolR
VVVTIDKKGGIYINDVWSRLDDFETKLDKEMKLKHTKSVFLRSDSTVAYGIAIDVIGRMKTMGIEQIGLVTAQAERARRGSQRK